MEIRATPAVDAAEQRALLVALERADVRYPGSELYRQAWRRAGLLEAVDDDEQAVGYAPSPRSTRGATRA